MAALRVHVSFQKLLFDNVKKKRVLLFQDGSLGPKKSEVEVSDAVGTISLFLATKPPPVGRLGLDLDEDRADLFRQLHPGP